MKNRDRSDIIAVILEAANGGITRSRLLANANLTTAQLRQYMEVLLPRELIEEFADEGRGHVAYKTTERGMQYLSLYMALKSIAVLQQQKS